MKNVKKRMAAREGFTLVELIVVIAILAILAAVAYPAYTGYIEKAKDAAAIEQLDVICTAAQGVAASKGTEAQKIEVKADSTITVTCKDTAKNFDQTDSTLKLLLTGDSKGTITITLGDGAYKEGATWLLKKTESREAGWTGGVDA